MKTLFRLGAPLALSAAVAFGVLAGCKNTPLTGSMAPRIQGETWVEAAGPVAPPAMEGKWILVQFFAPT